MRLDQELVQRGLCASRTEAQELIDQGSVLVNKDVCTKQTRQVRDTDEIVVTARRRYVSRGGEKLSGIMLDIYNNEDAIQKFITGKKALDVGSSTGGFTDYLLQHGITKVDAVDVGTNQLHQKIREDSKVTVFENTDIRSFVSSTSYDIIVADLSFIPLTNVLDDIVKHGHSGTEYFLLVKPQFEVGKGNTKKGIVKDEELVTAMLLEYKTLAQEKGLERIQVLPCHIQGGDGNQEYFLYGVLK